MNIDSGSSARFTVALKDFDGNPAGPTELYATVSCLSPPQVLRPETIVASSLGHYGAAGNER